MRGILKLAILVVVIWAAVKYGKPWLERTGSDSEAASSTSSPCISSASQASNAWGSGIGRFTRPPIDQTAWSDFRSNVEAGIAEARADCSCPEPSCETAREAMQKLQTLVSEFDSAARSGSAPPNDAPRRQEEIDRLLTEASSR